LKITDGIFRIEHGEVRPGVEKQSFFFSSEQFGAPFHRFNIEGGEAEILYRGKVLLWKKAAGLLSDLLPGGHIRAKGIVRIQGFGPFGQLYCRDTPEGDEWNDGDEITPKTHEIDEWMVTLFATHVEILDDAPPDSQLTLIEDTSAVEVEDLTFFVRPVVPTGGVYFLSVDYEMTGVREVQVDPASAVVKWEGEGDATCSLEDVKHRLSQGEHKNGIWLRTSGSIVLFPGHRLASSPFVLDDSLCTDVASRTLRLTSTQITFGVKPGVIG